MKHRPLISTVALLGVAAALAACAPVASQGSSADSAASAAAGDSTSGSQATVTVYVTGDTNVQNLWEAGIVPAYEAANPGTNVEVTFDLHGERSQQTVARLAAATEAGEDPGFDLIDAGFVVSSAADGDMLLEIDGTSVAAIDTIAPETVAIGKGFGVPYRASSVLLAYDSERVTTPPATLDELLTWIEANPGLFAYNSPSTGGSGGAFVTTVLDSFLTTEQRDALRAGPDAEAQAGWAEGFARLKALGPAMYQNGVYPNGNTQVLELLGSGEIAMAPVWSDQFITATESGLIPETVTYTQISDPSFTGSASYLGVPKTSDNTEGSLSLINFILSADGQRVIADEISGYPVVDLSTLPEDIAARFTEADPSSLRPGYYSENGTDMNNQWDQQVP